MTCAQPKKGKYTGFTLIEVLVALGMVAIALAAGVRVTYALTDSATRQSDLLLAQLCAENEIIKIRLAPQMPNVGDSTVVCEQAGRTLQVSVAVQATSNTEFRRVDVKASQDGGAVWQLSTVVARN
jgi:general secretion pathway protein I